MTRDTCYNLPDCSFAVPEPEGVASSLTEPDVKQPASVLGLGCYPFGWSNHNMSQQKLCEAIRLKRLVRFHYTGDDTPGFRIVEPHMVAYNQEGHLALSAWYVHGASEKPSDRNWRQYLLAHVSQVTILDDTFPGSRPGYKADGGVVFHNVQCAL